MIAVREGEREGHDCCAGGASPVRENSDPIRFVESSMASRDDVRRRAETRPERKSDISQPGVFEQRVAIVRSGRAGEHYTPSESERYTEANISTEREMAVACLGLLGAGTARQLLLDLGTGSALSAHVVCEAGHICLGIDVAWAMLALARTSGSGSGCSLELLQHDLGKGLPLRSGTADGAISVAVLQWLCDDPAATAAFFDGLRACLAPGARVALQFYPTPSGAAAALAGARAAGFDKAELLIDMPHATRGKKLLLALQRGGGGEGEAAGGAAEAEEVEAEEEEAEEVEAEEAEAEEEEAEAAEDEARLCPRASASALRLATREEEEDEEEGRAVCPLSWPMPAGCVCNGRWHSGSAPPVFPPVMAGSSCCEAWKAREGQRKGMEGQRKAMEGQRKGMEGQRNGLEGPRRLWPGAAKASLAEGVSGTEVADTTSEARAAFPWVDEVHRRHYRRGDMDAVMGASAQQEVIAAAPAAPVAPVAPVALELASARAASLGRLQHHHMKYVRRAMHALMGNTSHGGQRRRPCEAQARREGRKGKRLGQGEVQGEGKRPRLGQGEVQGEAPSSATSAAAVSSPTPSPSANGLAASLYLGGTDGGCDRCTLLKVRGAEDACAALCEALSRQLDRGATAAGLRIEHAHCEGLDASELLELGQMRQACEPLEGASTAFDGPSTEASTEGRASVVDDAEAVRLAPLSIDGHAPHATARVHFLRLTSADGDAAGLRGGSADAAKLLVAWLRAAPRRALATCAIDVAIGAVAPCGGISAMRVSMALRGRFASGAGHETAEEAQKVDLERWRAEVRGVLAEICPCCAFEVGRSRAV